MPEICRFFGIIIQMYHDDHAPPHIHIRYSGVKAKFDIETANCLSGKLPKKAHLMVVEWIFDNQDALKTLWELAQQDQPLHKLPPLE
jgi:hypothetical protein